MSLVRELRQPRHALGPTGLLLLALLALASCGSPEGPSQGLGAKVVVTPGSVNVVQGDSVRIRARLFDAGNREITERSVTWTSSNSTVASVSTTGMVIGVSDGVAQITARVGARSGVAIVTVSSRVVSALRLDHTSIVAEVDDSLRIHADALDQTGAPILGRAIRWASTDSAVVFIDETGLVIARALGSAVIQATSDLARAYIDVTVAAPRTATIAVTPDRVTVDQGAGLSLQATASDKRGRLVQASFLWGTADPTVATVDPSGRLTAVGVGSTTVGATFDGVTGSATVTVTQTPVGSVVVTPASATVIAGRSLQLSAVTRSGTGATLEGRAVEWSTSDATIATVSSGGLVTGIGIGSVQVTAGSEGRVGVATLQVTAATATSLRLVPGSVTLLERESRVLQAIAIDDAGAVVSGATFSWLSDNSAVATVDASGRVTAVLPGETTIRIRRDGLSAASRVTVQARAVATLSIEPSTVSLELGEARRLVVTARDAEGFVLSPRDVAWRSSAPSVASVDAQGQVTAVSIGEAEIAASVDGVEATSGVRVTASPVATVAVIPAAASLTLGRTAQLSTELRGATGAMLPARAVTWQSSDPSVVTTTQSGLVTGVARGSATITATVDGVSGYASVAVSALPVATVSLTPVERSVLPGESFQLVAVARDAEGGELAGRQAQWTTSNALVATVSATGVVVGVAAGSATITATIEGRTASATVSVVIGAPARVVLMPSSLQLREGRQATIAARVEDDAGQAIAGCPLTWSSLNPSIASVGSTGTVTGLAAGSATIAASCGGVTGSATVTVEQAAVQTVSVTPLSATLQPGQHAQLTAVLRDDEGVQLVGREVTWTTSNASVATVGAQGNLTAVGEGTATITASADGRSGAAAVTVAAAAPAPVPAAVQLTPSSSSLMPNEVVSLSPTLRDSDGNVMSLSGRTVAWGSSNTAVASVSQLGLVTALAAGSVTITATVSTPGFAVAVQGTASVAVSQPDVRLVTVIPSSAALQVGQTIALSTRVEDGAGVPLAGRLIVWSSSDPAVAQVDPQGVVSALAPGTASISAANEGQHGTSSITVSSAPSAATPASVSLTPPSVSLSTGGTQSVGLALLGSDGQPMSLSGRTVTWSSADPGIATVSQSGLVSAIAPGATSVSVTVSSLGIPGGLSASATVTVTTVPVVSVSVTPSGTSLAVGQSLTLLATPRGPAGQDLTGRPVSWSSSNTAVVTVDQSGRVLAVATGVAVVTATSEAASGQSTVTVTGAPVPTGPFLDVNAGTTFQTMQGWEATSQIGQAECNPTAFQNWRDPLLLRGVQELGLNRIRLEIRSGTENPIDWFARFRGGSINYATWKAHWYEVINDNANATSVNAAGFQFSALDLDVEQIVLPMQALLQARGERLYVNLNYVDFATSAFEHSSDPAEYAEFMLAVFQHLQSRYGFTPDAIEIALEPDNTPNWNPTTIGRAIIATGDRLKAAGFRPAFIAPSTTNATTAVSWTDALVAMPRVMEYLTDISYHRYAGVSDATIQAIGVRGAQNGLRTGMLEHIGSDQWDLLTDLTLGRNSQWQQFAFAYCGTLDDGGIYYLVDQSNAANPTITLSSRAKFLRQYFLFIRMGAVRVGVTSGDARFVPVAFRNSNGKYVVVANTTGGGSFTIRGLPAGTYGVKFTTSAQFNVDAPDVVVGASQGIPASIPAAGVITIYQK